MTNTTTHIAPTVPALTPEEWFARGLGNTAPEAHPVTRLHDADTEWTVEDLDAHDDAHADWLAGQNER